MSWTRFLHNASVKLVSLGVAILLFVFVSETEKKDPLSVLVKSGGGGSKRNALLKWCQAKTAGFKVNF